MADQLQLAKSLINGLTKREVIGKHSEVNESVHVKASIPAFNNNLI